VLGRALFEALIALQRGWGLNFVFLFDADSAGCKERDRYINEFDLDAERTHLLNEIDPSLKKIEDLVDDDLRRRISSELSYSGRLTKKQILRYFQEQLAKGEVQDLGVGFNNSIKKAFSAFSGWLTL